jgi:hypothetical protein
MTIGGLSKSTKICDGHSNIEVFEHRALIA